jgi:hypothetical protein
MRWYLGYPVLAAGLVFGAHTFFPSGPDDRRPSAADLMASGTAQATPRVEIATAARAASSSQFSSSQSSSSDGASSRVAAFSPGEPLANAQAPRTSLLEFLTKKLGGAEPGPDPAVTAEPVTIEPWKSAVVMATPAERQSPVNAESGELQRVSLTRDIQRELRRVGCYMGEIDGVWGGGSRRAILVFMDRVNALLPTNDPDVFMLSLLRSQSEGVCGATCPQGQSLTQGGRCLPNAILANAGKHRDEDRQQIATVSVQPALAGTAHETARDHDTEVAWDPPTVAEAVVPRPVLAGRMSIGGPKLDRDVLDPAWTREEARRSGSGTLAKTAALETASIDANASSDSGASSEAEASSDVDMSSDVGTSSNAYDGAGFKTAALQPALIAPPTAAKSPSRRAKVASAARTSPPRKTYRHVQRLFEHPLGRM